MGAIRRLTIWVLLAAVTLALGDGPFVDEVLEQNGIHQGQDQTASIPDWSEDAGLGCLTVYATLMHAAGVVSHAPSVARGLRSAAPEFAGNQLRSRQVPPSDKPPKLTA